MLYRVKTFRDAGLEARWRKTSRGQPYIALRNSKGKLHQREKWWVCDVRMFDLMKKYGIVEGFDLATLIGDVFSIEV